MKLKGHLMMGLIGLAMIAAPITASAQNTDNHKYETTAPHAFSSPARENRTVRNVTPPTREERVNRTAPEVSTHRDAKEVREDVNRWDANRWNDRAFHNYDYRDYGYRDYGRDYYGPRAEGYYVMPQGYAGGACAWARHLNIIYNEDRNTGHPAAAADLLPQLHNAERACGGIPYGFLR
jgi:hypothetical protein